MFEDIAVLTAGQLISEDLGIKLENVTLDMLGRAKGCDIRQGEHHDCQWGWEEYRYSSPRCPDQTTDRGYHL